MKVIKRMLTMDAEEKERLIRDMCRTRSKDGKCPWCCTNCISEMLDEEYVEPKKKYVLEIEKPSALCKGCPLYSRDFFGDCYLLDATSDSCPLKEVTK